TGLSHYQYACGDVPRVESQLPEAVDATASDVTDVESSGSRPPYRLHLRQDPREHREIEVDLVDHVGEPGRQQGAGEHGRLRHADLLAVEARTVPAHGCEHLVAFAVVDDTDLDDAVDLQRDGHAVEGEAMGVVDGAVEWVDYPPVGAADWGVVDCSHPCFLTQDGVARVTGEDHVPYAFFAHAVDLGHQVDGARLGTYLQVVATLCALDRSRFAGSHHGCRQIICELVLV